MDVIHRNESGFDYRKLVQLFFFILLISLLVWGLVEVKMRDNEIARQEHVVVYYPKSGPTKTFDGATHLRYHRGHAEFVYMGKKVRLSGDMEITKR